MSVSTKDVTISGIKAASAAIAFALNAKSAKNVIKLVRLPKKLSDKGYTVPGFEDTVKETIDANPTEKSVDILEGLARATIQAKLDKLAEELSALSEDDFRDSREREKGGNQVNYDGKDTTVKDCAAQFLAVYVKQGAKAAADKVRAMPEAKSTDADMVAQIANYCGYLLREAFPRESEDSESEEK